MEARDWKIVFSVVVFVTSLVGAAAAHFTNRRISHFYSEALSAGAFLGVTFTHMIPSYLEFEDSMRGLYRINSVLFIAVLLVLFLCDFAGHRLKDKERYTLAEERSQLFNSWDPLGFRLTQYLEENGLVLPKQTIVAMLLFLTVNSASLGVSFGVNKAQRLWVIGVALSVHKFFEVMTVSVQLLKVKVPPCPFWVGMTLYSMITPTVAVIGALMITELKDARIVNGFNAVAAATYMFVGGSNWFRTFLCPYEYQPRERVRIVLLFLLSLCAMGAFGFVWFAVDLGKV